jgi:hypothetical protein
MNSGNQIVECAETRSLTDTVVQRQNDYFAHSFAELWRMTPETSASWGGKFKPEQQTETESRIQQIVSNGLEDEEIDQDHALLGIQRVKSSVRDLVVQSVVSDHREKTEELLGKFSDTGDAFVHEAREFDCNLSPDDIFQALRNLWIVNSMQAAYDIPICATPSGIAYSLLYPYTDNFLDDPSVASQDKRAFNQFLGRRLVGISVPAKTKLGATVLRLVAMIESEYPRQHFPEVYESLLAIHRAQETSLLQHAQCEGIQRSEILDISVRKGGTSVLTDAYLSKGRLTKGEAEFAFGYGVFLQFIDDLQDVGNDMSNGHQTLFTRSASEGELDGMANRLLRFVERVLAADDCPSTGRTGALTELITKSCRSLILESVALNPSLYSKSYLESVESFSPLRFERIRELHEQMQEKQKRAKKILRHARFAQAMGHA